ncbi:hypothetical protein Sjap_015328 [Stephania japonica]|uniref:Uncharacterized protein n=1 Tax=Stephania japonica TaxID=461633 RepID=A0AAP0NTW2_9MAGN
MRVLYGRRNGDTVVLESSMVLQNFKNYKMTFSIACTPSNNSLGVLISPKITIEWANLEAGFEQGGDSKGVISLAKSNWGWLGCRKLAGGLPSYRNSSCANVATLPGEILEQDLSLLENLGYQKLAGGQPAHRNSRVHAIGTPPTMTRTV